MVPSKGLVDDAHVPFWHDRQGTAPAATSGPQPPHKPLRLPVSVSKNLRLYREQEQQHAAACMRDRIGRSGKAGKRFSVLIAAPRGGGKGGKIAEVRRGGCPRITAARGAAPLARGSLQQAQQAGGGKGHVRARQRLVCPARYVRGRSARNSCGQRWTGMHSAMQCKCKCRAHACLTSV
jgi:hypothetical protein